MPTPEVRVGSAAPGTLVMGGALVFDTAADALRRAGQLLRTQARDTLDLEGITRADSAGLACVLAVMATAARAGSRLRVVHTPPDLVALARVCDVESLLT